MTLDSLPSCEIDASPEKFRAAIDRVAARLEKLRLYDGRLDDVLTLHGNPFLSNPVAGILANAGKPSGSKRRPARFVLPADRLSARPLGEFVAMARRRDGDGWATVKTY